MVDLVDATNHWVLGPTERRHHTFERRFSTATEEQAICVGTQHATPLALNPSRQVRQNPAAAPSSPGVLCVAVVDVLGNSVVVVEMSELVGEIWAQPFHQPRTCKQKTPRICCRVRSLRTRKCYKRFNDKGEENSSENAIVKPLRASGCLRKVSLPTTR